MFNINDFSEKILGTDISEIGLTTRTINCLRQNDVKTVRDLVNAWQSGKIQYYRNVGPATKQEITNILLNLSGNTTDKTQTLHEARKRLEQQIAAHEQELQKLRAQLKLLDQGNNNK